MNHASSSAPGDSSCFKPLDLGQGFPEISTGDFSFATSSTAGQQGATTPTAEESSCSLRNDVLQSSIFGGVDEKQHHEQSDKEVGSNEEISSVGGVEDGNSLKYSDLTRLLRRQEQELNYIVTQSDGENSCFLDEGFCDAKL